MNINYCVTGHRPNKLFDAYPEARGYRILVAFAEHILLQHVSNFNFINCGMALGWDMAIAQACINLNIPLVACIPFKGQSSNWPKRTQEYYDYLVKHAFMEVCVSEGSYSPYKMQVRNEFMVDNAFKVIALWNGTEGGTSNCVKYANKKGIEVINCWEEYNSGLKLAGHW